MIAPPRRWPGGGRASARRRGCWSCSARRARPPSTTRCSSAPTPPGSSPARSTRPATRRPGAGRGGRSRSRSRRSPCRPRWPTGRRRPTWQDVAVRVWPLAALRGLPRARRDVPLPRVPGHGDPAGRARGAGRAVGLAAAARRAVVAACLALMVVPGTVHRFEVAVNSIRAAGDPVLRVRRRAGGARRAGGRPAARRRARARLRRPHDPVQDRPRGLRRRAVVDAGLGGARARDAGAVRGRHAARRRRRRSPAAPARASRSSTAGPGCATCGRCSAPGSPACAGSAARPCTTCGHEARRWILFAVAALVCFAAALVGIQPNDEGLMLQAAARIADGQVPYRDFWWFYPPGQPALLGGLWALFGPSLLTWKMVRALAVRRRRAAGVAARPARRRAAVGGAGGVAGGDARARLPERPAPVPGHARALPRRAAVPRAAGARRRADRGGRVLAAGVRGVPRARHAARVRGAGRLGAHGGALRGHRGRASPRVLFAPFVVAGGAGRRVRVARPLPVLDFGDYQALPFPLDYDGPLNTGSPGGFLSDSAESLLLFYLPLALCSALAGALAAGALRFRRADEWWRVAVGGVRARDAALPARARRPFHTAPLAVMVAILAAWAAPALGRRTRRRRAAAAARRRRSPSRWSRGSTGSGSSRATAARRSTCPWPTACACPSGDGARPRGAPCGDPGARARPASRSTSCRDGADLVTAGTRCCTCSPTGPTRRGTTSRRRASSPPRRSSGRSSATWSGPVRAVVVRDTSPVTAAPRAERAGGGRAA